MEEEASVTSTPIDKFLSFQDLEMATYGERSGGSDVPTSAISRGASIGTSSNGMASTSHREASRDERIEEADAQVPERPSKANVEAELHVIGKKTRSLQNQCLLRPQRLRSLLKT